MDYLLNLDMFHRVACNGNVLSPATTTYSFVTRGIFVGCHASRGSGK
jgi:hypothetical protein